MIICWILTILPVQASWFLWEDLWIDLYGQIDQNYKGLEQKQYKYELTGQWEGTINEVLAPIFADYGIECNISTPADIDTMLSSQNIEKIIERCTWESEIIPAVLVQRVNNALLYIRQTYMQRAEIKAKKTFEVERIGLYSDGNIENSPFDLVEDLIQIDTIIFSEELEYEWTANYNADEVFQDFLSWTNQEAKSIKKQQDEESLEKETWEWEILDPEEILKEDDIIEYLDYHEYVCAPENETGLNDTIVKDIIWDIEWYGPYIDNPSYWDYPTGIQPLDGWWTPTLWWDSLTGNYTPIRDDFPCDSWFCITVEFKKSDYGLAGWETNTIESVLKKAWKHLEKPANASLTQRKQTTNNFELGSIIKDLPWMLRGFGIEVSSKPVPILDIENQREDSVKGDLFEVENLLTRYYKNQWLDYERRNDLSIFWSKEHEQKVFQTAWGMPITYTEDRLNELSDFQSALRENNRIVSESINNEIITRDLKQFSDLFAELEIFTLAIEDFSFAFTGNLWEMKKIPTRSP